MFELEVQGVYFHIHHDIIVDLSLLNLNLII